MKTVSTLLAALVLALAATSASAISVGENLLGNAGFEEPIRYEEPEEGNWLAFFGPQGELPINLFAGSVPDFPYAGEQSLELRILDYSGTFVGVFQDVGGLEAGQPVEFSGWLAGISAGGSVDPGLFLRIEWVDSGTGQEISRTPNLMPTPGNTYEQFLVEGIVPAGADTARVVAVMQSATGPALLNVALLDELHFAVVPLPGALLLMLGALVPLGAFRKRVA